MMYLLSSVSPVAVVLAALSNMLVGMIWYSSSVFGPLWMKWTGTTKQSMRGAVGPAYAVSIGASILSALVLAQIFALIDVRSLAQAWLITVELWLGFCVTFQFVHAFFERRNKQLILLYLGHELAVLLAMATVLRLVLQ